MQTRQSPLASPRNLMPIGAGSWPRGRASAAAALHSTAAASLAAPRLTVVLDMDECIIHTTDFSDDASGYRQTEASRDEAVKREVATFQLKMGDGVTATVHKRPGLEDFLTACAAEFDTYVFTAGTEPYASPLLDVLDPEKSMLMGAIFD